MSIKLTKTESLFRNELIFAVDAKAINIEHVLVNLYMLLEHNGMRPRQKNRGNTFIELKQLMEIFPKLEEEGKIQGAKQYPQAIEAWLRNNLTNLVFRGNADKENISSLRPLHIQSYKVRNAKHARDYNTADQIYLMLQSNESVKNELKNFLAEGWDDSLKTLQENLDLDIDTVGILNLVKSIKPGILDSPDTINKLRPLLEDEAKLFCDDIRRLLTYRRHIPRKVMIEYLKILISFHLFLYIQKLIMFLPKIMEEGTTDINRDYSFVVDCNDNTMTSKISYYASRDVEKLFNSILGYVKATYQFNSVYEFEFGEKKKDSGFIPLVLKKIKEKGIEFEAEFKISYQNFYKGKEKDEKEEIIHLLNEVTKYEDSYFDKYIQTIVYTRSQYHFKYHTQFIDNAAQKNREQGIMAQGNSKKYPRRFALGTRLLETLVQILVLKVKANSNGEEVFTTNSLSVEELMSLLRSRYGIIINGNGESRFKEDQDLTLQLAFRENAEAFKNKLRQIGFFNDLSDAYILQKIQPRYEI